MKLLHTSDWHLGQSFMGKSRQEEHQFFLDWLFDVIKSNSIDVLVVAGDIFDTTTPPNYAFELYYNFLTKLSSCSCKSIIITAGNHDSISTLKAPKQLLKALNIYVIASGDEDEEEIIKIYDKENLIALVCAVPFLRDYVVRKSFSAESKDEKESSLNIGIKEHYKKVYDKASFIRGDKKIPIVATGHLTTVGSKISDSEREIYIGGSLHIDSNFLASMFEYVALGHLHINQDVGSKKVCYSGSPIPLSFSEATSQKKVNIVEFKDDVLNVKKLNIPPYRTLLSLHGDSMTIIKELEKIKDKKIWIEVCLDDENPFYANQLIRQKSLELGLTLLALKIEKKQIKYGLKEQNVLSLDELTPLDVFYKCLEKDELEDGKFKDELIFNFKQIVEKVQNI